MADVTLDELTGQSAGQIMITAASRNFRMETAAWMQLVHVLLRAPDLLRLRLWWDKCPTDTRRQAFQLLTSFVPANQQMVMALGNRVRAVDIRPLSDSQMNEPTRLSPTPQPSAVCDDPDVLWVYLYVHFVTALSDAKTQDRLHQLEAIRHSRNGALQMLGMAVEAMLLSSSSTSWINEDAHIAGTLSTLLAQIWQTWSKLDANHLGQFSMDFFLRIVNLTSFVQPVRGMLDRVPIHFLFQIAGGESVIQSMPARKLMADCLGSMLTIKFDAGPDVVHHTCRALVDIREISGEFLILSLNVMARIEAMLGLRLPLSEPFLYERAAHRMLDLVGQTTSSPNHAQILHAGMTASLMLLRRVAQEHPHANIIEPMFWRLTALLSSLDPAHRQVTTPIINGLVCTPGNRTVLPQLFGLCTSQELCGWHAVSHTHRMASNCVEDSITGSRVLRVYKFSVLDSAGVGVETMLRHFAAQGMSNPFTNQAVSWDDISAANPGWLQN